MGHVYPDLVGAAGVQLQLHQGAALPGAEHPVAGGGGLARRVHLAGHEGAGDAADGASMHPPAAGDSLAHRQVDPPEGGVWSWPLSCSWAWGCLATTSRPEVPLSSRWTGWTSAAIPAFL